MIFAKCYLLDYKTLDSLKSTQFDIYNLNMV